MQNSRSRIWWLCYGTFVWGIPFFVAMTAFWGIILFIVESLLRHRVDWKFYTDPQMHAVALLIFCLVMSLSGGFYWGSLMWNFYDSKRQNTDSKSGS